MQRRRRAPASKPARPAALKVYDREAYPWLDLRMDEHPMPVADLRRVSGVAMLQLRPFVAPMPTRAGTAGVMPEVVSRSDRFDVRAWDGIAGLGAVTFTAQVVRT